jgi:hypothetical protein
LVFFYLKKTLGLNQSTNLRYYKDVGAGSKPAHVPMSEETHFGMIKPLVVGYREILDGFGGRFGFATGKDGFRTRPTQPDRS